MPILTRSTASAQSTTSSTSTTTTTTTTQLLATAAPQSLKPAAIPLMDAGKAFARSGEFLIDLTTAEDLYGGALSAVGAQIRNAGDCIAQAAASCRFKTGTELVIDELREAGTCLQEGVEKLKLAVEEAVVDERPALADTIQKSVSVLQDCSTALEEAGAAIMQREQMIVVGMKLVQAGSAMQTLSPLILSLSSERQEAEDSAQRMSAAAKKMTEAGNNLQGIQPKATGKSWLKGGI